MHILVCLVIVLLLGNVALADGTETISTTVLSTSDRAKGFELASGYAAAANLVKDGHPKLALETIEEVIGKFEKLFDRTQRQYSFQSAVEFREFSAQHDEPFEWIDWTYHLSLQLKAYLYVEARQLDASLQLMDAIETISAVSANTSIERGYVLNQLKQFDRALAAYQRAFDLSETYASQKPHQSAALRGMGFSLIELGRIDEAQKAYEDSLIVEPGNELATRELRYIQGLRKK